MDFEALKDEKPTVFWGLVVTAVACALGGMALSVNALSSVLVGVPSKAVPDPVFTAAEETMVVSTLASSVPMTKTPSNATIIHDYGDGLPEGLLIEGSMELAHAMGGYITVRNAPDQMVAVEVTGVPALYCQDFVTLTGFVNLEELLNVCRTSGGERVLIVGLVPRHG